MMIKKPIHTTLVSLLAVFLLCSYVASGIFNFTLFFRRETSILSERTTGYKFNIFGKHQTISKGAHD